MRGRCLRLLTARCSFDVASVGPFGESHGIVAESIGHDGVKLAHDLHTALNRFVNGCIGGDRLARELALAVYGILKLRDACLEVFKKACGQAQPNKSGFERLSILCEGASGGEPSLRSRVARQAKLIAQAGRAERQRTRRAADGLKLFLQVFESHGFELCPFFRRACA